MREETYLTVSIILSLLPITAINGNIIPLCAIVFEPPFYNLDPHIKQYFPLNRHTITINLTIFLPEKTEKSIWLFPAIFRISAIFGVPTIFEIPAIFFTYPPLKSVFKRAYSIEPHPRNMKDVSSRLSFDFITLANSNY